MPARLLLAALVAAIVAVAGCDFPRDPDGTLDRVEGGTLRVGFTVDEPWVEIRGDQPAGIEPDLVRGLAEELEAEVDWTEGSEEQLVAALEEGRLARDLARGPNARGANRRAFLDFPRYAGWIQEC